MKQTTEKLLETPLMAAELQSYVRTDGKTEIIIRWAFSSTRDERSVAFCAYEYNVSPAALDCLAEQFKLASIQLYALAAELDPGRAFAENQAIAFGAERLEGDLPRGEE